MIIGGIISWAIKSRSEELRVVKEKLREERRNIYEEILEPYFHLFTDPIGQGQIEAIKKVTSYEYKKIAFKLNLFGSDKVIKSYNNLIQSITPKSPNQYNPKKALRLLGTFLFEIRKSLGNKRSKLSNIDMLKGIIKDIDNFLQEEDKPQPNL